MKNKKTKKLLKVYGLIGKSLCVFAGGIIGLIKGGSLVAIPSMFFGGVSGFFLEKGLFRKSS